MNVEDSTHIPDYVAPHTGQAASLILPDGQPLVVQHDEGGPGVRSFFTKDENGSWIRIYDNYRQRVHSKANLLYAAQDRLGITLIDDSRVRLQMDPDGFPADDAGKHWPPAENWMNPTAYRSDNSLLDSGGCDMRTYKERGNLICVNLYPCCNRIQIMKFDITRSVPYPTTWAT
eukprot:Polyplicarium_translucidae@DN2911_c0_g1_i10.p2